MSQGDSTSGRRRFLKATGAAAVAGAFAGCTGGGDETDAGTETEASTDAGGSTETEGGDDGGDGGGGNTLELIVASITSLDPIQASDTASGELTAQLYDGLLRWPDGGVPVENTIASDVEIADDFVTYTFTLKEGVQFHNGDEVTAQDVVYSWERLAASENSQAPADILSAVNIVHEEDDEGAYVPGTLQMEAVDDYTFRFEIESPFPSALQVLANNQFAVVPEGIVGDIEGYDGEIDQGTFASEEPVGAGPFEFQNWDQGTEASVTAFDDYHGEGPALDRVHWSVIEDSSAIYNFAMNGNADAFTIPTAQYEQSKLDVELDDQGRQRGTYGPLRNGETADVVGVPTLNIFYIGFNMQETPKPVRQAVAHVLNQDRVANQVFKRRAVPAYHYMTPSIFPGGADAAQQHAEENYPYGVGEAQIDQARQLMEDAGYSEDDPYELPWVQYQSETWLDVANTLRDKLASAHIQLEIEQAPFSTLLSRVRELNVEAYTLAWIVPWAAPDAFVKHLDPERSDPTQVSTPEAYNAWPTDTEAAQKAIDAWTRYQNNAESTDEAQQIRNEAAVDIEEANWEDVANLPVYHEIEQRFTYQNVDMDPFGAGGSYRQKHNTTQVDRS